MLAQQLTADQLGPEVGQVASIVARLGTPRFAQIVAEVTLPLSSVDMSGSDRDQLAMRVAAQKLELVQHAVLVMISHGLVKVTQDEGGCRYEFVVERAVMRLRFPYFVKHVRREMCCFAPAAARDGISTAHDDVAARLVRMLLLHGRLQQTNLIDCVHAEIIGQRRAAAEAAPSAAAAADGAQSDGELRAVLQQTFDELFKRRYFRRCDDGFSSGASVDDVGGCGGGSGKRQRDGGGASASPVGRKRSRHAGGQGAAAVATRSASERIAHYDAQLSSESYGAPLEVNVDQLTDELLVAQCLRFARLRPSAVVDSESDVEAEEAEEGALGGAELTFSAIFHTVGGLAGAFKSARGYDDDGDDDGDAYDDDGVSFKVTMLRKEIKARAAAAAKELERMGDSPVSAAAASASSAAASGAAPALSPSRRDIDALRAERKVLLQRRVRFGRSVFLSFVCSILLFLFSHPFCCPRPPQRVAVKSRRALREAGEDRGGRKCGRRGGGAARRRCGGGEQRARRRRGLRRRALRRPGKAGPATRHIVQHWQQAVGA